MPSSTIETTIRSRSQARTAPATLRSHIGRPTRRIDSGGLQKRSLAVPQPVRRKFETKESA